MVPEGPRRLRSKHSIPIAGEKATEATPALLLSSSPPPPRSENGSGLSLTNDLCRKWKPFTEQSKIVPAEPLAAARSTSAALCSARRLEGGDAGAPTPETSPKKPQTYDICAAAAIKWQINTLVPEQEQKQGRGALSLCGKPVCRVCATKRKSTIECGYRGGTGFANSSSRFRVRTQTRAHFVHWQCCC